MSQPSRGVNITRTAQQFKGMRYVWGGTSPKSGFDCSGLVQYVYAKWGIYLPRCASEQVNKGVSVKQNELQPGDLVFFQNTYKRGLSHVGIFVGDGWFIHASKRANGRDPQPPGFRLSQGALVRGQAHEPVQAAARRR